VGAIWAVLADADAQARPDQYVHYPGALDPDWVQRLPVPIGEAQPPGASVALLEKGKDAEFERPPTPSALHAAYRARPRTRVHEDIGRDDPDAWYSVAAGHLGRMAACDLAVTASLFCSRAGDVTFGAHVDAWVGVILQLRGAKIWEIGEALLGGDGPVAVVMTRPGDVLLIPKYMPHQVDTPRDPGTSLHLAFAVHRDPGPTDAGQLAGAAARR